MKQPYLKDLITKLSKARNDYIAKHGAEPVIWEWNNDLDGLELCEKVEIYKTGAFAGARTARRPYMKRRITKP